MLEGDVGSEKRGTWGPKVRWIRTPLPIMSPGGGRLARPPPSPLQCASFSTEMAARMTVLGTQMLSLSQTQCSVVKQFNTSRAPSLGVKFK